MRCMILLPHMHQFPFKKQKAKDYLVMVAHVVPATPGAESGRTLGALSLTEEKRIDYQEYMVWLKWGYSCKTLLLFKNLAAIILV